MFLWGNLNQGELNELNKTDISTKVSELLKSALNWLNTFYKQAQ